MLVGTIPGNIIHTICCKCTTAFRHCIPTITVSVQFWMYPNTALVKAFQNAFVTLFYEKCCWFDAKIYWAPTWFFQSPVWSLNVLLCINIQLFKRVLVSRTLRNPALIQISLHKHILKMMAWEADFQGLLLLIKTKIATCYKLHCSYLL